MADTRKCILHVLEKKTPEIIARRQRLRRSSQICPEVSDGLGSCELAMSFAGQMTKIAKMMCVCVYVCAWAASQRGLLC